MGEGDIGGIHQDDDGGEGERWRLCVVRCG